MKDAQLAESLRDEIRAVVYVQCNCSIDGREIDRCINALVEKSELSANNPSL
jgi:hypothetical protein